jgi:hypothetical protein
MNIFASLQFGQRPSLPESPKPPGPTGMWYTIPHMQPLLGIVREEQNPLLKGKSSAPSPSVVSPCSISGLTHVMDRPEIPYDFGAKSNLLPKIDSGVRTASSAPKNRHSARILNSSARRKLGAPTFI